MPQEPPGLNPAAFPGILADLVPFPENDGFTRGSLLMDLVTQDGKPPRFMEIAGEQLYFVHCINRFDF